MSSARLVRSSSTSVSPAHACRQDTCTAALPVTSAFIKATRDSDRRQTGGPGVRVMRAVAAGVQSVATTSTSLCSAVRWRRRDCRRHGNPSPPSSAPIRARARAVSSTGLRTSSTPCPCWTPAKRETAAAYVCRKRRATHSRSNWPVGFCPRASSWCLRDRRSAALWGITPTRSRRRVKHLKHETSTKHQCAATITLEMTSCEVGPSAGSHGFGCRYGFGCR